MTCEELRSCVHLFDADAPSPLCVTARKPITAAVDVCVLSQLHSICFRVIEGRLENLGPLNCSPSAFLPNLVAYLSSHDTSDHRERSAVYHITLYLSPPLY